MSGKARALRPEFFSDDKITAVSPPARLLMLGLWIYACDNGHVKRNARQLAVWVFPADPVCPDDVDGWLAELDKVGLIKCDNDLITTSRIGNHNRLDRRYWKTCDTPGCARPAKMPPAPAPNTTRAMASAPAPNGEGEGENKNKSNTIGRNSPRAASSPSATDRPTTATGRRGPKPKKPDPAGFAEFWANYPTRKVRRIDAADEWRKATRAVPPSEILDGLARLNNAINAGWIDPQFVPEPARWLKHGRWTDELGPADRPRTRAEAARHAYTRQLLAPDSPPPPPARALAARESDEQGTAGPGHHPTDERAPGWLTP